MFAIFSPGTELRRFRKGTMPKIAVTVLLFIPLIYGALYLWAFWAPTEELGSLPVALVNEDTGSVRDGNAISAGRDVVDELVDGQKLDWRLTDAADAASGVADGQYYFAVTIPQDFSAAAVSVGTDEPRQAQVQVEYNDSNSFLASTLGKQAMSVLRDAVAVKIGEQTADAMLVGLNEAGDGIRSAAEGAGQLAEGIASAQDGAGQLVVGLGTLADGAASLDRGAGSLADGTEALASGLAQLSTGAGSLSSGAEAVATGAGQLQGRVAEAADGSALLASSAWRLADGATAISEQTGTLVDGTSQLSGSLAELLAAMQAAPAGTPASAFLTSLQGLAGGAGELNAQAQGALPVVQGYAASSSEFAGGVDTLASKLDAGRPGAAALASGASQLSGGANELATKSGEAASGANAIATGAAELSNGVGTLRSGTGALVEGGTALQSGASQLASGSETLADELTEGGAAIPDMNANEVSQKAAVLADPVALDQSWQNESTTFGEGFAPFFIALATFVGALIT